jgi:[histone H3]-trimethyl-L-lysine4 demethylase
MSAAASMAPQITSSNNIIPLSARKSPGLDLGSVERRGQPTAVRLPPKVSRPHGLQEAPTFYPTEEEFRAGPLEYIRKIAEEGSKYGIVKIIPPEGWNPTFAIDTEVSIFNLNLGNFNIL